MRKVEMKESEAVELFYTINAYYVFLRAAENVDKVYFRKLSFWNSEMNKDLIGARYRVSRLLDQFNKAFKAIAMDELDYDVPGELYEAVALLSRMPSEEIKNFVKILQDFKK